MTDSLLAVNNLKTWFDTRAGKTTVVDDISFTIQKGETFALLGESGCGKSMTALSIMQLLPSQASQNVSGEIWLDGEDLLALPEAAMRNVRGKRVAMIFQEPQTSLNPVLTVGTQIAEVLPLKGEAAKHRVIELLEAVGIPAPAQRVNEYPHQLSGGMKQRVMIAIALAGEPDLLIADEPTTALDVTIQAQVLDLLKKLQKDTGMAVLMITHDLAVVSEMVDHVAVMYAGQIAELASRDDFFQNPKHPYSQKLFEALPSKEKRETALAIIPGTVPLLSQVFNHCRFEARCQFAGEICRQQVPPWKMIDAVHGVRCFLYDEDNQYLLQKTEPEAKKKINRQPVSNETLLKVDNLKIHFPVHKGLLKRIAGYVYAVDEISIDVKKGQTLALVGESGCGKTTLGKGILQLVKPTGGHVVFAGTEITGMSEKALRRHRKDFQIIFQDPFSSMNPRMMVGDIIEEGMIAQNIAACANERKTKIAKLLEQVGLRAEHRDRYPHEFSGGQRQRICVARALAVSPKLIICDEPTSALDVSVQAQILNLLKELQEKLSLTYLFITHNISVVAYLADEVAVMYLGRIVEKGRVEEVLDNPEHPYTKALLSAVPTIDKQAQKDVLYLQGDPPSPIDRPQGCFFHPRCPHAIEACKKTYPEINQVSPTHQVSCHLSGTFHTQRVPR
ncbi:MAG TPA: ABC transporter ATP-binding protein [Gammaproteobacteria bacterium]|nr:ABC transporter ATP-binding protein [Gammaproteobacteria bacterium]